MDFIICILENVDWAALAQAWAQQKTSNTETNQVSQKGTIILVHYFGHYEYLGVHVYCNFCIVRCARACFKKINLKQLFRF